jgi:acyl dehydratase
VAPRRRFDEVREGQEIAPWTYQVQRVDLIRYAGASGDFNPIHWNEAFAKAVGLPDVISHGMYTMARMGQYVTDWCGDPGAVRRLRARFTAPVVVPSEGGASVTVSGRVARTLGDRRVVVELTASAGEARVATGEAELELA